MLISEVKQVKANSKKPKLIKPNTGHESPHPMRGKLVGEGEIGHNQKGMRDIVNDFLDYCKGQNIRTIDEIIRNYDLLATRFENITGVDLRESPEPITEEQFDEAAGEKDACYHKVKSRYKVWPSAYASGALVKCRKVGAKNWGNSSKKKKKKKKK